LRSQPYLIGIAGPSCAGKTALAQALAAALPEPSTIFALDSYYRQLAHLPPEEREARNFDHPDALDWELIVEHVRQLARGAAIDQPVYLFDRHMRGTETKRLAPAPFVIVEGLFALYEERVRAELAAKLFVAAPDPLCFDRRKQRDVAERGRTLASVCRQYGGTVRPMAEQFVIPTQAYADVTLRGDQPLSDSVAEALALIGAARGQSG
jgi:uridine kinase